jgi:4-carboxymuconolactone decarboxylase
MICTVLDGGPVQSPEENSMSDTDQPTVGQRLIGDFAPKLAQLTDDVVFGDIWARPELARRDRSLITVAALITNGSTEQLRGHLAMARTNGLTEAELKEVITHLAFYAGWPRAMSALTVAREVFGTQAPASS